MFLARLGDLDAAEEHLHLALGIHGLDRRRTRAIVLADLGGVRLRQGDVDGTLATWRDFLDCADGIRSVKVHAGSRTWVSVFGGTAESQRPRSYGSGEPGSLPDSPERHSHSHRSFSVGKLGEEPGYDRARRPGACTADRRKRESAGSSFRGTALWCGWHLVGRCHGFSSAASARCYAS